MSGDEALKWEEADDESRLPPKARIHSELISHQSNKAMRAT